ncbi:MAG: N-acetyltransferase DgcN [Gammaproteobacteria bacterium]
MQKTPYLLFLGDAADTLAAKVALGIRQWRPRDCVGQLRLAGCNADAGLPDLSITEARKASAQTLVVGVANRGGVIADNWVEVLINAVESGMDVAAGLHNKLADVQSLKEAADRHGRQLFDVRHPAQSFAVGSGKKRSGKRLLPVGTDCSCGKMYTALALEKEMLSRDMKADFRATGQTGILIAGSGVSVDAVVADFISGAVETLAPANEADHWDLIEGQGSLFHPSFAGVTMGLIHGAQPDALVLCHEPTREHMRGLPEYPIPDVEDCMDAHVRAARLTNSNAEFVGVCVNTSALQAGGARRYLDEVEERVRLPAVDPVRDGVGRVVDQLIG